MAAFIMLGLPDGTLGVAWPSIRSTFGLPLGALGLMLAPATASYLLSGVVSGHLITRFGLRRVLLGSMAMFLISLALVGISPLWWFLPLGTTVLGFGAGTLDTALNAFAATHHAQRFLGLLHAAYSAGAALGPFLVLGAVSIGLSWRGAYGTLSALALAMLLAIWFAGGWRLPATSEQPGGESGARSDDRPVPLVEPSSSAAAAAGSPPWPLLLVSLVAFFVYTGTEVSGGQWAYSFLTLGRHTDIRLAGAAVSAFWWSQTLVRAGSGFIAVRIGTNRLVYASLGTALLGAAMLWWAPGAAFEVVAMALFGGGLGPLFPTLISLAPSQFGARAVQVVGYEIAAAAIGGATLAAATGLVLQQWGLWLFPLLLVGGAAATIVLHYAGGRLSGASARAGLQEQLEPR
jgi:fucose permease